MTKQNNVCKSPAQCPKIRVIVIIFINPVWGRRENQHFCDHQKLRMFCFAFVVFPKLFIIDIKSAVFSTQEKIACFTIVLLISLRLSLTMKSNNVNYIFCLYYLSSGCLKISRCHFSNFKMNAYWFYNIWLWNSTYVILYLYKHSENDFPHIWFISCLLPFQDQATRFWKMKNWSRIMAAHSVTSLKYNHCIVLTFLFNFHNLRTQQWQQSS